MPVCVCVCVCVCVRARTCLCVFQTECVGISREPCRGHQRHRSLCCRLVMTTVITLGCPRIPALGPPPGRRGSRYGRVGESSERVAGQALGFWSRWPYTGLLVSSIGQTPEGMDRGRLLGQKTGILSFCQAFLLSLWGDTHTHTHTHTHTFSPSPGSLRKPCSSLTPFFPPVAGLFYFPFFLQASWKTQTEPLTAH